MLRTKEVPYVYSRDGIFYFTRRIPNDLKGYYRCPRLVLSLAMMDFCHLIQHPLYFFFTHSRASICALELSAGVISFATKSKYLDEAL